MATVGSISRDLADPSLYVNREFSWLDFNARVLALAADHTQPLLERCKFLAIFSSNLDEFFMVRVAGVMDALDAGRPSSTPDQLPRDEVLAGIRERVLMLGGRLVVGNGPEGGARLVVQVPLAQPPVQAQDETDKELGEPLFEESRHGHLD